jgi:NADPH2:quinone reductase
MHAIVVSRNGAEDVLVPLTCEEPLQADDELLVDVAFAGVNFIDIYQREGTYQIPLPYTPGLEGSGVVRAVGSAVQDFAPGDRVAWTGHLGSYAEVVAVPADKAVHLPHTVSLDNAAAIMLQGLTAHYLITSVYPIKAGDLAVVHAAAGGVGLLLTQMICARGGEVLGTVSTEAKASASREAGATHIIRYDQENFYERVMDITEGAGVNVVYDGVGASTFDASLRSLRPRGTLALYGQSSGPVGQFDPQLLNQLGSLILTRPSLAHFTATPEELRWRASEVLGDLESGYLHLTLHQVYPLAEAKRAHEDLGSRVTSGKLLLRPSDLTHVTEG